MALNNINNTNQSMARLVAVFSDMYAEITRIKNYYGSMRSEAKKSFSESKQYWIQKAYDESGKIASLSNERIAEVEEMIRELDVLEQKLCAVDKSYAKRRDGEFSVQEHQTGKYDSLTDCFSKLKELHDEASRIAQECSLTVKAQPIQELGMLFSNKRKQKYERLYHLIVEAKHLRRLVFSDLDKYVNNQNISWNNKKVEEIDKASEETAELIEAIDAKEEYEISKIIDQVNLQLDSLLSARDVAILKEMKALLGADNVLPEECCEHILIGDLKIDVSSILAFQEVVDYMNAQYADCFIGTEMILPAIYDLRNNFDICFDGHGNNTAVKDAIHSVMLSMLENQPASRQTFILSDPEGRAKGFDTYLDFARQYPDVFGERILTTKEQIKTALRELSSFVDDIGQTKFVGYRNIFDYNIDVPDKQEHLRCLCLLNFPKYFDGEMLEDLLNIVKNGKPYGVQVLIGFDDREINDRRAENQLDAVSRIIADCIHIEYLFGKWRYSNGVSIEFNQAPTYDKLSSFLEKYGLQYSEVKDTTLPLTKILTEEWFSSQTRDRLSIPIGKNEDGKVQSIVFGEGTSHHALVIGSLGSGKSTLLHTIIMSSLINFSPDEINLYLMDFKSGTEFKVYAEHSIPHIKLLALDAMQEFGQSILDELWAEMNRRSTLFNELIQQGMDVKDITDYRRMTGKKMPRILVIADEFQLMVSEEHNRKIANYCGGKIADFISLSRVYGIHFILATQTMSRLNSGFAVRKSTINEMYVRIGLKCIESECTLLFGENNSRAAFKKMGSEKGSAVYVRDYSQDTPVGFKVAFCDQNLQKKLLDTVENHYSLMEVADKTKVFIGSSVPNIKDNEEFMHACSVDNKSLPVYLGEPIKIDAPTRINLNRTKRNNLLVVGGNQEMIDRLVGLYMANILRIPNTNRNRKKVYLFDGLSILGETSNQNVKSVYSRYQVFVRSAADNCDAVRMIDELYSEYLDRKENRTSFEINAGTTIAVVINNMQWIESISLMMANRSVNEFIAANTESRTEESSTDVSALLARMDSFMADMREISKKDISNISYGKKLAELIENGYTCGIHFVMSVPDFISIKEYMYSIIPKFGNRILFSISNEDACRLVSDAKTEMLRDNIVVYYDGISPSYQIKPYSGIPEYINQI